MNFKKVLRIYRKELTEMLRDRRTLFTTIILPVILYPIIFIGLSSMMSRQETKMTEEGATVIVLDQIKDSNSKLLISELKQIPNFKIREQATFIDQLYKEKAIQAIVTITDSTTADGVLIYKAQIKYDKSNDRGDMTYGKLVSQLNAAEKKIVGLRLRTKGVPESYVNAVAVIEKNTASSQQMMGIFFGRFLPYMLIMMIISGGAYVATDLVAGEKERKTLETLLVSSAHRNELVLGKYLTIMTVSAINVLINLLSIYFSVAKLLNVAGSSGAQFSFPLGSFALILIALIPLITLFAAVLLSISTFSRNMKEARAYEGPMIIVAMMLSMISFLPGFDLSNGLALIPIINISLLFKEIMLQQMQINHFLITIGSTLFLDIIAIFITIRLFNTESVLFRTEEESVSLKSLRSHKKAFFSPYYGLLYYIAALAAFYYIGFSWQKHDLVNGLMQTQLILIFLPVFLILRLFKQNPREILRLKPAKAINYPLVILMAFPMFVIATSLAQLVNLVFPFPAEYLKSMNGLTNIGNLPISKVLLLIALLPAICEETMFRGFIMRFYENYGKWAAIIIAALLFGLFHLDMYRMIPVTVLGIWLGYLVMETDSIHMSMLAHFMNNGLAVMVSYLMEKKMFPALLMKGDNLSWWLLPPSLLLFIMFLYIFRQQNRKLVQNTDDDKEILCAE
ncbi:MAG TPA: ABC transporter permease subunit/CPBP intramembrane protease [Candidatus Cloacimonadota bacterium]|nr:ABC transporter permease subunit/CPBP intramembrane protease [Candidatus Cloacimonadota bacterium]